MKQDRISEITKKAIEIPLEFTQLLLEKTEKIKTPSSRVDKIGRSIGTCAGAILLVTGSVGLLCGKYSWAIGALTIGTLTTLSNTICTKKSKE